MIISEQFPIKYVGKNMMLVGGHIMAKEYVPINRNHLVMAAVTVNRTNN